MSLSKNVGKADRVMRLLTGALLIALPFLVSTSQFRSPFLSICAIIVGLVLIATGFFRFCPLYRLLGTSTTRMT